jgi:alpha-ketoglutarate-dependent taurine dioxygenase
MRIPGCSITPTFPAVITPDDPMNFADVETFLKTNGEPLRALLLKYGAILLRGFPIQGAQQFSQVIEGLQLGRFVNYIGGDSPRDKVEDKVYTSTEAPPTLHIPLHQELSFVKNHPRHIYFYCETAPRSQGETIIGDARKILRAIDPDVLERFKVKGLKYTSNYYHKNALMRWVNRMQRAHKSWTEVFETENKKAVEKHCATQEFEWQWTKNDWLRIMQTRPATLMHPITNEEVWFNQAHLYDFNPKLLGWSRYLGAKLFYWRRHTLLHEIAHADNSKVAKQDLYHILDVLHENTIAYPWQKNDVMVLDNILTMHGRAPFEGPRRVLTALTA